MSLKGYSKNPHRTYTVQCSYIVRGERRTFTRVSYANSDILALVDTYKNVLVSQTPGFTARVVSHKEY